ncbi:N-glycosylation protein [Hirsutella rhossiliensis]|uniref:N-glycosylation protein n=1 Tax=Hirsutella rhossiliensis TaxID=111463 RepID=A0A9P8MZL6_9HYPO|nr:N-glycosylation protein [Hirsutella rhossiliensis]KAH0964170.1 N-glycosylation protein [Hirsutella rhossiliensis]
MATIARPQHRVSSTAPSSSLANKRRPASAAARSPSSLSDPDSNIPPAVSASSTPTPTTSSSATPPPSVYPSFLQPRVAVVLKVPQPWHPWLFALRLCSILPALWWGLPSALQLLLRLLPGTGRVLVVRSGWNESPSPLCDASNHHDPRHADGAVPYALTEGALATIWCFACGYLSFFFTDCLMSRWLINYTPQATMVRLLTINAVNAYVTLTVLSLTGGFDDPRLLLPGWIGIATTLTVCYHITHQKINIRKETVTSINVFSIASYITMVILLVHMHSYLADYPTMPIVARGRHLWNETAVLLAHIKSVIERAEL